MIYNLIQLTIIAAVKDSLKQDGRLGRFKAELRSAVMSILNKNPASNSSPAIPEETKLINELIREYLVWNGYLYSEQTVIAGILKRKYELLFSVNMLFRIRTK